MDNITHSLVGYAVAKSAKHLKIKGLTEKFKDPKVSSFFIFISIFAANFPDLDLIYSLYDSSKLGYLVHHRGHTHTFIWTIPQALVALLFSALIFKIKDKVIWAWGFGLILLNIILHISLDALNIYGVHPFYPWDNSWYYGDRVFIIEPLIWFSILPLALTPIKKLISLKTFLLVFFLLPLILAVKIQMMSVPTAMILGFYFLAMGHVFNKMYEGTKTLTSVGFTLVVILGFITEGLIVENHISNQFTQNKKQFENLEELAITPYPGNPFCWNIYLAKTYGSDGYQVSIGQYQSRKIIGFKCPKGMQKEGSTALQQNNAVTKIKNFKLFKTYDSSKKLIFDDKKDCRLQNWFQFVRIPFLDKDGNYVDLRFTRSSSRDNFTLINLNDESLSCVKAPAPWLPPRAKLLESKL